MPGVFKLCASCLGYNALQREENRAKDAEKKKEEEEAEEAVMLDESTSSTKARMGILKIKKREGDVGLVPGIHGTGGTTTEGEDNDLLACKNDDEEGEEGDSGACVDEFPVAIKDTDANSGEAETTAESSAAARDAS